MNPKLVSLLQTIFYSCLVVVIPIVISAFGVSGALYGTLPVWATGGIIWYLNYLENQIQAKTGKALFGAVEA